MGWGWLKKAGRRIWGGVKFLAPFLVSAGLDKVKKKNPEYAWLLDAIDEAVKDAESKGYRATQLQIVSDVSKKYPTVSKIKTVYLATEYLKYVKK